MKNDRGRSLLGRPQRHRLALVGPLADVDVVVLEDVLAQTQRVVHVFAVLDASGDGVPTAADADHEVDDRPRLALLEAPPSEP